MTLRNPSNNASKMKMQSTRRLVQISDSLDGQSLEDLTVSKRAGSMTLINKPLKISDFKIDDYLMSKE